ncbi:MAG: alpha/beta fold hydrolase [Candidatus Omnitrophica bacterium]|nr:alpha/beta fold hydrolase [Candidatus Omnitrophota bacterium]
MQPIILAHGFIGYRKFMFWSMFDGVAEALRAKGYTALQPVVHPTASIEERAAQWVDFIEKELGPDEAFHWIGHSMGGLDGRYIASPGGLNLGRRFLTLTTLSTPHHGSPLAERIPRWARITLSGSARAGRFFFGGDQRRFLDCLAECRWDGLEQLSPEYIDENFNPRIADHSQVRCFSYAGCVDYSRVTWKNVFRQPVWRFMKKINGPNDGMVSVESAKWGVFKGVIPCDHGEMVGLRIIPWAKQAFDHVDFFVKIARELEDVEKEILNAE